MNIITFQKTAEIMSAVNDLTRENNGEKAISEACDIIKTEAGKKDFVLMTSCKINEGIKSEKEYVRMTLSDLQNDILNELSEKIKNELGVSRVNQTYLVKVLLATALQEQRKKYSINEIVSANICGRAFKLSNETYSARLRRIASWITAIGTPDIIPMQEFLVGKDFNYLKLFLEFLDEKYEAILPVEFKKEFKSGINIVFVKKDKFDYDRLELEGNKASEYANLYNYVLIRLKDRQEYRILNLHLPQLSNSHMALSYQEWRAELSDAIWKAVLAEVRKFENEEKFYVCGDLNADKDTENSDNLAKLRNMMIDTLTSKDRNNVTYENKEKGIRGRFDYIFTSKSNVAKNRVPCSFIDSTLLQEKISDHASVRIQFA